LQEIKGRIPKVLDVELLDDLVNICMPGDDITLTGIIKVFEKYIFYFIFKNSLLYLYHMGINYLYAYLLLIKKKINVFIYLLNTKVKKDKRNIMFFFQVQGVDDGTTKIQVGTPFSLYMKAITVINNKHRYQNKSTMNTEVSLKNYLAIQVNLLNIN